MNILFAELAKHLNQGAFLAGFISGIALSIAVYTVGVFISAHWKSTLIISAVVTALSLLLLAI